MKAIPRVAMLAATTCLACLLHIPFNAASAQEYKIPPMGGNGGSPFRLGCDTDAALVGIAGRTGAWLDSVQPICQQFINGAPAQARRVGAQAGGNGGQYSELTCPNGAVVTGMAGSWGAQVYQVPGIRLQDGANLVHEILLRCERFNAQANRFEWAATLNFVGSQTGSSRRTISDTVGYCRPGTVGIAFEGRSGIYIDNVTLVCRDMAVVSRVTLQSDGTKRDAVGKGAGELAPKVTAIDCPAKVQAPPAIVGPAGDWAVAGWPNLRLWKVWTDNTWIICGYVTANDRANQPDTWRYNMKLPAGQRCNADPSVPGRVLCTPSVGNTERFNYQGGQGGPPRPPPPPIR